MNQQKSAPTWSDKSDLPNGSYSIPEIQDCFEFIIKKHETLNLTWIKSKAGLSTKEKPGRN